MELNLCDVCFGSSAYSFFYILKKTKASIFDYVSDNKKQVLPFPVMLLLIYDHCLIIMVVAASVVQENMKLKFLPGFLAQNPISYQELTGTKTSRTWGV